MNLPPARSTPDPFSALDFGRLRISRAQRCAWLDGQALKLGSRALDLLLALAEQPGRMVPAAELMRAAWPRQVVEENNLRVQIAALRRQLGAQAIVTAAGRGYGLAWPRANPGLLPDHQALAAGAMPPGQHNLPAATTALLGRGDDWAALQQALAGHALVTLVGSGGIGKTRLALAAARGALAHHAHGVWWVDLAALQRGDQVVAAVATVLRVPLADADALPRLATALAPRDALLVLDNCEHLAAAVATLVQALLQGAPRLKLLATSQRALGLAGEKLLPLAGLAVPPPHADAALSRGCGALQLLAQRLLAADERCVLDDASLPEAAALCRHLDGLPLAIEMAAPRAAVLGLACLNQLFDDRFRLLSLGLGHAPGRHPSLRAALAWSHGLLSPAQQQLLHRLSVFAGSFSLDSAQRLAGDGVLDAWMVLDALTALVQMSMLHTVHDPQHPALRPRFRLLETTRAFAAEGLRSAGQTEATARRHTQAMAALADEAQRAFWLTPDQPWLDHYRPDHADLEAAFQRAAADGDADAAAVLGEALHALDSLLGQDWPAPQRLQAALRLLPRAEPPAAARLWNRIALRNNLAPPGLDRLSAAASRVAAWRQVPSQPQQLCLALAFQAVALACAGQMGQAEATLDEIQALEDPAWPPRLRTQCALRARMFISIHRADAEGYRRSMLQSLRLAQLGGAVRAAAQATGNLADAALMAGDARQAVALGQAAVAEFRALGCPNDLGFTLGNLCNAQLLIGEDEGARLSAAEAWPLLQAQGTLDFLLDAITSLAVRGGHHPQAAALMGYADADYQRRQYVREPNERRLHASAHAELRRRFGAERLQVLLRRGASLDESGAAAVASEVLAASLVPAR